MKTHGGKEMKIAAPWNHPYEGFALLNRSHRKTGWHITYRGYTRWGTLEEIKADVDCVRMYGHLPCERRSWA